MTAVVVLLSTFNAGLYLKPLVDSVLAQEEVSVRLVIRDDGSSDGTPAVLSKLAKLPNVAVSSGTNIGPCQSYFRLLSIPAEKGELVALCDQDDVWLPKKLSVAAATLKEFGPRPALYCGRLTITDSALRTVGQSPVPRREMNLSNALVENAVMGPTVVVNEAGRALLARHTPRFAVMHDAWAYLVFSALGKIVYDNEPRILYRLHENNRVGLSTHSVSRARRLVQRRVSTYLAGQVDQAREFEMVYGAELSARDRAVLAQFCALPNDLYGRFKFAFGRAVYRQRTLDDVLLRVLLLIQIGGISHRRPPATQWP